MQSYIIIVLKSTDTIHIQNIAKYMTVSSTRRVERGGGSLGEEFLRGLENLVLHKCFPLKQCHQT